MMPVLTWIARLVSRPLRADGRWLFPILLSASIALASLVPVEALHDASEAEFGQYSVGVLGADLRIEVNSLDPEAAAQLSSLLGWVAEKGAQFGRVYEVLAPVRSSSAQVPIRIIVVDRAAGGVVPDAGHYPFYGGELWSSQPTRALDEGVAISTNAMKALGVAPGDEVTLGSTRLRVAASFPENLLTMVASGSGGSAMVAADKIPISPDALGGAEVVVIKFPVSTEAASQIRQRVRDTLGKAGVLGSEEVAPAIEVGLTRLKQAFLWCGLLILFMCAFGLAFGVEDYMNSKGDEIATLKVLGFSPRLVGLILVLRLALAGLVAGLLGVGFGWLMAAASARVVGAEARSIARLIKPSAVP